MELLLKSKDIIREIKNKVENFDSSLLDHHIINNYEINENAISIVMTSSNRSTQTYFTLQSMLKSKCKNIHIILVDDSTNDPININILKNYPYYIDFISIKRENKNWVNPCVNYNIGFKYIKGNKVVIQNAEVCHIGDPLDFINNKMSINNYYVFDVKTSSSYENNEEVYKSDLTNINIYNSKLCGIWYQHIIYRPLNYHFLTALYTEDFNKINGFSYDYTMGNSYDDNDFILKIKSQKLNFINVKNEEHLCGGLHLFHTIFEKSEYKDTISNKDIFNQKNKSLKENNNYIEFLDD
jgi:hypothetical protein